MSKEDTPPVAQTVESFVANIAQLCALPNGPRIDRQNLLAFRDEIAGNSPLDYNADDARDIRNRSWVLFRGLKEVAPDQAKFQYCADLFLLAELSHYKNDEGIHAYDEQISELVVALEPQQHSYPDVSVFMDVATALNVGQWL